MKRKNKKQPTVKQVKNKEVPFTIKELFVISLLANEVEFLSHKIGLRKQVDRFTENEKFVRALDIQDELAENIQSVERKYLPELQKTIKELNEYRGKDVKSVPKELTNRYDTIVKKITDERLQQNNPLFKEFDNLTSDKQEFYFPINDLAKKAIAEFVLKENRKIKDLKMTQQAIESLVDIYCKIEKQ